MYTLKKKKRKFNEMYDLNLKKAINSFIINLIWINFNIGFVQLALLVNEIGFINSLWKIIHWKIKFQFQSLKINI